MDVCTVQSGLSIMAEQSGGLERNHKAMRRAKLTGVVKHVLFTQRGVVIDLDYGPPVQIGSKISSQHGIRQQWCQL